MDKLLKKPLQKIGYDFIDASFLEKGQDEYHIREEQFGSSVHFRRLTDAEIGTLVKNDNRSDNWDDIRVSDAFDPGLVRRCRFHGRVRIGALEPYYLEYHELKLPVGLYNSTILSCDFGDHVAIHNVSYLANYIIGREVVLFNISEMQTTDHAKFGNGILKEGEPEHLRIWLEIGNENGNRKVLPFESMLPADAWLWAKFRDDLPLMEAFEKMTEREFDSRRGYYGEVGDQCVIKNTQSIKDVKIGSHAYIKGANKLKNLTIRSNSSASSQIGEGVELVNGIMGYGSRAFYGVKAVRFILGENSTLKYGARLINSILGDNSNISCCEVLNSLIFPGHEQHHNNSFLIASTIFGQSNIAAGATIGSNHNSRGADGEIVAGRGFWPGLSVSLMHNSSFASFCLLARGDYPAELNIRVPFALVSSNEKENCLNILPAFWWLYNMYALTRNAWKYQARDKRSHKLQSFESDFLAPDTIDEIFRALHLLEQATEIAYLKVYPAPAANPGEDSLGKYLLLNEREKVSRLKILVEGVENSKRETRLLKVREAYRAYREMIHYYGIKTLLNFAVSAGYKQWEELKNEFGGSRRETWNNLGGQLVLVSDFNRMITEIKTGSISTWEDLHQKYRRFEENYGRQKAADAFAALLELHQVGEERSDQLWNSWLNMAIEIAREMARRTRESRKKDYLNPFRRITFRSAEEMDAVQGALEENVFIRQMEEEAINFEALANTWKLPD